MTVTSLGLLDTSIAQLQTLLAFLDEQLDWTEPTTQETHACKEIARSLYVLIRTLQAAGRIRPQPDADRQLPLPKSRHS